MIDFMGFKGPKSPERRKDVLPAPRELIAEHARGRSTQVFLNSPQLIGQGHFGVVYAVTARTIGMLPRAGHDAPFDSIRRGHESRAVIKVFYEEIQAQSAFSLYDVCKDAGLHVATTYRLDAKQKTIIMTEFGGGDSYAVSGNNWSVGAEVLEKNKLGRIENWDALMQQLFTEPAVVDERKNMIAGSDVLRATVHEIELQHDVYFFITPIAANPSIEAVAGDFDLILHPSKLPRRQLLEHNVKALGSSCMQFIKRFVHEDARKEHLDKLFAACDTVLARRS